MNQGLRSLVHVHVSIIFDWKMMAVIALAILIRLLMR